MAKLIAPPLHCNGGVFIFFTKEINDGLGSLNPPSELPQRRAGLWP